MGGLLCLLQLAGLMEGGACDRVNGIAPREFLPAFYGHVEIKGVNLDTPADAAGFLGRYERRARAEKGIEHDVAAFRHVPNCVREEADRLYRGVHLQKI